MKPRSSSAASLPSIPFQPLRWPLRSILGWRSEALQVVSEQLTGRLPRLVVERFSTWLEPDLFSIDGFHPNARAHTFWGDEIAALALPLLESASGGDAQ